MNEKRFELVHDISEWNGKYQSKMAYNFSQLHRNTEIPGTIKPPNTQKVGPDHDIFINCNPHVGKRSLTLGMIDMSRTATRAQFERDKLAGRRDVDAEGILGNGPGAYDPEKVRLAHHM